MWSTSKYASSCIWLANSHIPCTFPTNQIKLTTRCFSYSPFLFQSHMLCAFIIYVGHFVCFLLASYRVLVCYLHLCSFVLVKLHSISDISGCFHIVAWSGSSLCRLVCLFIHSGWSLLFAALLTTVSNIRLSSSCTEYFPSNICSANS